MTTITALFLSLLSFASPVEAIRAEFAAGRAHEIERFEQVTHYSVDLPNGTALCERGNVNGATECRLPNGTIVHAFAVPRDGAPRVEEDEVPMHSPTGAKIVDFSGKLAGVAVYSDGARFDGWGWNYDAAPPSPSVWAHATNTLLAADLDLIRVSVQGAGRGQCVLFATPSGKGKIMLKLGYDVWSAALTWNGATVTKSARDPFDAVSRVIAAVFKK